MRPQSGPGRQASPPCALPISALILALMTAQEQFLSHLPRIQDYARCRFRFLRPEAKAEAIAEVTAISWASYRQLTLDGREPEQFVPEIVKFACKHVAAKRKLTGQPKVNDILSERAHLKGIKVDRLGDNETPISYHDQTPPPDQAAFREMYTMLLESLPPKKKEVVEALAMGERPSEIADRLKISRSRVTQMRGEVQKAWERMGR